MPDRRFAARHRYPPPQGGRGRLRQRRPSWSPPQEIGDQREPELLALLGMELRARHVVFGDEGGDRAAVIGARHEIVLLLGDEVIGMDEIGVQPAVAGRDAFEQSMLTPHAQRVPAHMRDLEVWIGGRNGPDLALDPAEAWRHPMLEAALGHELKADADAEEGPAALLHGFLQRVDHAWDVLKASLAVGKGADAGEHD